MNRHTAVRVNRHTEMNFRRKENQATMSQQVHQNEGNATNSSQGSADARHFDSLGKISNILLNRNIDQGNPLHTTTITQEITQRNPRKTIIKGKINN